MKSYKGQGGRQDKEDKKQMKVEEKRKEKSYAAHICESRPPTRTDSESRLIRKRNITTIELVKNRLLSILQFE